MAFITWDDKFSVDIKEVDEQHKGLISIVNELHEAMELREVPRDTQSAA